MNYITDEEKLFNLYTLAEISYEKSLQNKVKNLDDLYPLGWYEKKNYKEKIEIIAEAIENNVLIINTKKYQDSINCLKKTYTNDRKNNYFK